MSIESELDALTDNLTQACNAANLPRRATVTDDVIEGFYGGTYPLIEAMFLDRQVVSDGGSTYADMVQTFKSPNIYTIRVRSAVDTTQGITPLTVRRELFKVVEAIEAWFADVGKRTLPDGAGNARALYAGPPFRWRGKMDGLYEVADGTLGQVLAGSITVLGLPRQVIVPPNIGL